MIYSILCIYASRVQHSSDQTAARLDIYICMYVCIYVYIYIYIEIERERDREREREMEREGEREEERDLFLKTLGEYIWRLYSVSET